MSQADIRETAIQWRLSVLRRLRPRPFGLAPGRWSPGQLSIGSESFEVGVVSGLRAMLTRSPIPLESMSLLFGNFFDLSMPLIEVTTHWNGGAWRSAAPPSDRPAAAWELGRAERRDAAIARENWTALYADDDSEPNGPFTRSSIDVIVDAQFRTVPVVSLKHYHALAFPADNMQVTVVSRHPIPELPRFELVTDLEPFLDGYARYVAELVERAARPTH
jgi:hypothetical protein